LTRAEIGRLARIDAVYGIAAVTLLIAGLTLWLGSVGKPAVYYTKNWVFHTKLTLFLIVGLLSIYPTIFFIKNRKGNPDEVVVVPKIIFYDVKNGVTVALDHPIAGRTDVTRSWFFG